MGFVYTIKSGDCLSSLAHRFGLPSWKTIYNDPVNTKFREKRPNPNLLFSGDQVFIPAVKRKSAQSETESRHQFQVSKPVTSLKIIIKDQNNQPMGNRKYLLHVGALKFEGRTKPNGLIDEQVPPQADNAVLIISPTKESKNEEPFTWKIKLGHLDPIEEVKGIQARLNNLGFNAGSVDGIIGPRTRAAVMLFQHIHFLNRVDGIPGPITQAKLKEVYGC